MTKILSTKSGVIFISSDKLPSEEINEHQVASTILQTFKSNGMVALSQDKKNKALHLVTCNLGSNPKAYAIKLTDSTLIRDKASLFDFLNNLIFLESELNHHIEHVLLFDPTSNKSLKIRKVVQFQGLKRQDIQSKSALKQAELSLAALCNDIPGNGEFAIQFKPTENR